MINAMKNIRFLFAALLVLVGVNSCQKDEFTNVNDDLLIDQETVAEQSLVDLDALVEEALGIQLPFLKSATTDGNYYVNKCPVITADLTSTPKTITIDFGTGCTGKDGKVRSGKIIVTSATLENFSRETVRTFDNFFVDGKKMEGSVIKTITLNREDHSRLANIKEDVTITFPDNGGKISRKADMTREYQLFILGFIKDNVITSWGTATVTRKNGVTVNKTIDAGKPLVFKMECHQIVSGVVLFKTSNDHSMSIDYGKGDCDNKATVTRDGVTREINIRK
jgi:hypothetical protein